MSTALDRRRSPTVLATRVDFDAVTVHVISDALTTCWRTCLHWLKTKGFHWHLSGRHFYDYHLMLDEQADQIFAMIDGIAERVRKIRGRTISSVGEVSLRRRLMDTPVGELSPPDMLTKLHHDNVRIRSFMREAHVVCEANDDVASASVLENWIDETERGIWFLCELNRD